MRFRPDRCPRPDCPSLASGHHRWCLKGRFLRTCDGRPVQRFLCLECRRTFSTQTFRLDYRLRKPHLNRVLIGPFVSKVTHRQAARIAGCSRSTVAHRLELIGKHCERFHRWRLTRVGGSALRSIAFQLDELETFEHSRRLAPVTMPVLIERSSYFVLDLKAAALPARGGLRRADRERKQEREKIRGRRRSGSVKAVEACFKTLARLSANRSPVCIQTDRKTTYPPILRRCFRRGLVHERQSSVARRNHANPLFPINHTLAMMRDGISRLVRRTWAASKLKERLERHAWIWAVWRNYVRGVTNRAHRTTPAMAIGIEARKWRMVEICAWGLPASA